MVVSSGADHADCLPSWYENYVDQVVNGDKDHFFQTLSVNLLNAELRFKRCEPHGVRFASRNFQEDASYLAFSIPKLIEFVTTRSNTQLSAEVYFIECSVRCYWLASCYFFWRGRCDSYVAKSADALGIEYLENCLECLSHCSSLATPHLDAKVISIDSVSKHRQNIQSSSVVSRARQIFHEIRERADVCDGSSENTDYDILSPLVPLGDELLQRYNVHNKKSSGRIEELLNDFISAHQDGIIEAQTKHLPHSDFRTDEHRWGESRWGDTWNVVPSSKVGNLLNIQIKEVSRPSIMTVLTTSLLASDGKSPSLFSIYSHMVIKALEMWVIASKDNHNYEATMCGNFSTVSEDRSSFETNNPLILSAAFFVDKLISCVTSNSTDDMKGPIHDFVSGSIMCTTIYMSFTTTFDINCNPQRPLAYFYLVQSISKLVSVIRQLVPPEGRKKIESCYFVCLVKLFMQLRREFSSLLCSLGDKRLKIWQSHLSAKADYISHVASEAADLMSFYPSSMNPDGQMTLSHVVRALVGLGLMQMPESNSGAMTLLAQYTHSLLWFWKICTNASSPENVVCARLVPPIASAIIALCGSPGISVECDLAKSLLQTSKRETKSSLTFSDYFDSEER